MVSTQSINLAPVIVVEGQNDFLAIRDKTNYKGAVIATIGQPSEEQRKYIENLVKTGKYQVYLLFDNDLAGIGYSEKFVSCFGIKILSLSDTKYRDIDELLKNVSNPASAFDSLIDNAVEITLYFEDRENTKDVLNMMRTETGEGIIDMTRMLKVSKYIKFDVIKKCRLLKTNTFNYLQDKITKKIYKLNTEECQLYLQDNYAMNPATKEYKFIMNELLLLCVTKGEAVTVYKLAHYDKKLKILYVSAFSTKYYKLDGNNIEEKFNGDDGIFFDMKGDPYERVEIDLNVNYFKKLMLDKINFTADDNSELTEFEQKFLFMMYILSFYFPELLKTRPILYPHADEGSGKSVMLTIPGKFIFGDSFSIAALTSKEGDFDTRIINEYYVVIDNFDNTKNLEWVFDKLAALTTGSSLKVRKLYSNGEIIEYNPNNFIAISSRTGSGFNFRSDITQRLLIIKLKKIEEDKYFNEAKLYEEIKQNRNLFWSHLLHILNEIVRGFRTVAYEECSY